MRTASKTRSVENGFQACGGTGQLVSINVAGDVTRVRSHFVNGINKPSCAVTTH